MWKVIQCASQGRGHVKDNIPCQDKTYCIQEKNKVVIALADGAGSAHLSHEGALVITKFICEDLMANFECYFSNNDGVDVKRELGKKISQTIEIKSKELGCLPSDLASTLLVVAIQNDQYILLHVGDGVIGYSKNNELKVASEPENGEFANTTVFTTSKDFWKTMRILKGFLGPIDGFVLMSDGTEASLYNKRNRKLADVIGRIMETLRYIPSWKVEAQVTRSFETVIKNATTDDCSMIIMVNNTDSFLGYSALNLQKRKDMLRIDSSRYNSDKRLRQTEQILTELMVPQTVASLSEKVHLKPKHLKKKLLRLQKIGVIDSSRGIYRTILNLTGETQ